MTTQHTVAVSLHVAILQGGRGFTVTEREEEGEERKRKEEAEEEKHQHLDLGYSSTENSAQHSWREEEERKERHNKMCWDYLLSQVMGACLKCILVHKRLSRIPVTIKTSEKYKLVN